MESASGPPSLSECVAVVVMGPTGSGKSTFISLLADQDVEVSHGLQSHTIRGRPYSFQDPDSGGSVMLMDMPGFDDTSRSDAEILRELSYSLAMLHRMNVPLAGLVYLHRISDPRMAGSAIKNLRLFKALCGEHNYDHVVLATTMWTEVSGERAVGEQRERELRNTYWADMVRRGSKVMRHSGSRESALEIVRTLARAARQPQPVTLAIQHELLVEGKTLDRTEVGRILSEEIDADRARAARDVGDLDGGLEEAEREGDGTTAAAIRTDRQAAEEKVVKRARDKATLAVGFRQLREQQAPKYREILRDERGRTRRRHVYTSYDSAGPSSQGSSSDTGGDRGKKATAATGLVRREGKVAIVKGRRRIRGPPAINERTSSLGKTRPEVAFLMYCMT